MKLKKLHITFIVAGIGIGNIATAQLVIDNAQFFIQPGATVTVQGDVTSNTNILGTGLLQMKGTTPQNLNMNGFNIPKLEIDNPANVTLTGAARIDSTLLFTNGKLVLGSNDLKIGAAGAITSATNAKFVVTDGTGKLVKAALGATAFIYPVGKSLTSYTPVSISNSGTADSIGARAYATTFTKEVVSTSWDISESVAGGSNLSVTTTWSAVDELAGFDRTRAGLSYFITAPAANVGWDLLNSQTGAPTGSNPYSYTRTGLTSPGTFAVGTRPVLSPLLFSPKIFLQGPYLASGVMTDNLRLNNLIPTTEPYSALTGYMTTTSRGSGGGETSTSSVVGSAAGASTNSTIVDWVLLQLHNAAGTVVTQRAVLLRRDGSIVETDGVSPVNFAGNAASAGPYFVSIRHRNHLGVRTAATLNLAKVTASPFDFTTALTQAYPGTVVTNNAMATLTPTVFGMWGGNANSDMFTRKTGSATANDYSRLIAAVASITAPGPTAVYRVEDINMDGNVRKTGSATTNDYSKLLSMLNGVNIITQPVF